MNHSSNFGRLQSLFVIQSGSISCSMSQLCPVHPLSHLQIKTKQSPLTLHFLLLLLQFQHTPISAGIASTRTAWERKEVVYLVSIPSWESNTNTAVIKKLLETYRRAYCLCLYNSAFPDSAFLTARNNSYFKDHYQLQMRSLCHPCDIDCLPCDMTLSSYRCRLPIRLAPGLFGKNPVTMATRKTNRTILRIHEPSSMEQK